MNHSNMSSCQWCEIIRKDSSVGGSMQTFMTPWSVRCIFLKLTVQEPVWLQPCYLWCLIAFCKERKYWQTVHHSCWINHLSTSQKCLQTTFIHHPHTICRTISLIALNYNHNLQEFFGDLIWYQHSSTYCWKVYVY